MTMFEKNRNVFVPVISLVVLNLQTCYGSYYCYKMSSGKDICFMFDNFPQTFEDSKTYCQINGGFLLEIYNEDMERLVEQFAKSKFLTFMEVWLNLVRTNDVWVWGGEGSDRISNYSNWEGGTPASFEGSFNHAFMKSYYKWSNAYEIQSASKICIRGNRESFWFRSDITFTTTTVRSVPATTRVTAIKTTTTATVGSPKASVPSANNATTRIKATIADSSKETTNSIISSLNISATTKTKFNSIADTNTMLSQNTATGFKLTATSNSNPKISSSSARLGMGLGTLVLTIVSSLLSAKFDFDKEIPLPFNSSRSRKSPPRETETDRFPNAEVKRSSPKLVPQLVLFPRLDPTKLCLRT